MEVLWDKSGLDVYNYNFPALEEECLIRYQKLTYTLEHKENKSSYISVSLCDSYQEDIEERFCQNSDNDESDCIMEEEYRSVTNIVHRDV